MDHTPRSEFEGVPGKTCWATQLTVPIHAVTLDCADTLIKVKGHVDTLAVASAEAAGIKLAPDCGSLYRQLYYGRLPVFLEANRTGNRELADQFYLDVCRLWLERMVQDPSRAEAVMATADRLAFGQKSVLFDLFEDTLPALRVLGAMGIRLAVLSNWDYTLHRVLEIYGLNPWLDFALASLEIGVEKPAPEFFLIALERLGLPPNEVLHVGDSVTDDIEGADGVGMHSCLIDRAAELRLPTRIRTLLEIPEVISCLK